jgi:acyl dehydratase
MTATRDPKTDPRRRWDALEKGEALPVFERTTGFGEWNRYAAVNDEFIDVHMSAEAARAAGQPDIFGMGNLRIAYVHNAIFDWLGGPGDIAEFGCQFRALNFLNDRLATKIVVGGKEERDGLLLVTFEADVVNQAGASTMPATATAILFPDGKGRSLPEPSATAVPSNWMPGVHLDAKTIAWLGRPLPGDVAYPVCANDIRRWAMATWHPGEAPAEFLDEAAAARSPWGELVAPRDFNPFAWAKTTPPDTYPWMRGMGTEPGRRGLNGGQQNRYFAPIRVGDAIRSVVTLVDAYEKEGRLGTMMFLVDEARWTNQRDELVRIGRRTTIYY